MLAEFNLEESEIMAQIQENNNDIEDSLATDSEFDPKERTGSSFKNKPRMHKLASNDKK